MTDDTTYVYECPSLSCEDTAEDRDEFLRHLTEGHSTMEWVSHLTFASSVLQALHDALGEQYPDAQALFKTLVEMHAIEYRVLMELRSE